MWGWLSRLTTLSCKNNTIKWLTGAQKRTELGIKAAEIRCNQQRDTAETIIETITQFGKGWTISEADFWLPIRSRSQSQLFKCGSALARAPPLSRSIILNYRKKVVLTGVPIGAARDPDTRQYRHNNQRLCFREAWHHSDADRQFSVSKTAASEHCRWPRICSVFDRKGRASAQGFCTI